MKKTFGPIFLIFSLIGASSRAQILLGNSNLSSIEMKSQLKMQSGSPYTDFMIDQLRKNTESHQLFDKAVRLRQAELEKDYDVIYKNCHELYDIRHEADWSSDERNYLARCMRHLAQLSTDPRRRLSFLEEEKSFSGSWTESTKLPKAITDHFSWALINGKSLHLRERQIKTPSNRFRLTLVSNRYETQSIVTSADELEVLSPKLLPLVSGDCDLGFRYESRHLDALALKNTQVLDKNCVKTFAEEAKPSPSLNKSFVTEDKDKWQVPNWVWWVAGGVASYALIKSQQDKKESDDSPRRTSKRGF